MSSTRRSARPIIIIPVPAILALALFSLTPDASADDLIPARFTSTKDSQGFVWDLQADGTIRRGTDYVFDRAMTLMVDKVRFNQASTPLMTPSGDEFVLESTLGAVRVVRRVLINKEQSAVRYIDVFESTAGKASIQVDYVTGFSRGFTSMLSNLGRTVGDQGVLEKNEVGIVIQSKRNRLPAVLYCLRGSRSKLTPQLVAQHGRSLTFKHTLELKNGKPAILVMTIAQRQMSMNTGAPTPEAMKDWFSPFLHRKWTSDLPLKTRRAFRNMRRASPEEAATTALLDEVLALAEERGLDEPGELDQLLVEEDAHLSGRAQASGPLRVTTRFGASEVPLAEVAALRGGGGAGRETCLYLRNGELLTGKIEAPGLVVVTEGGLEIPVDPAGFDVLLCRKGPSRTAARAHALLSTRDGQRLAVAHSSKGPLEATCPWGDLQVPLEEIDSLGPGAESTHWLWLRMRDGSRVPLAIHGERLRLETIRFGEVDLKPTEMVALVSVGRPRAPRPEDWDEEQTAASFCRLSGESVLVGEIALEEIHLQTDAGTLPVDLTQVKHIERSEGDGDDGIEFEIGLWNSEEALQGRISERVLPIRTARSTRLVPTAHLQLVQRARATADEDEEGADDDGEAQGGDEQKGGE